MPRERVALRWGMTQNNLGTVCERESGTARLDEAVAAFREALKERTRVRVPLDWAGTQNNLGLALASLGERESGTARLDEEAAALIGRARPSAVARHRPPVAQVSRQHLSDQGIRRLDADPRDTGQQMHHRVGARVGRLLQALHALLLDPANLLANEVPA